jgi:ParB family chromosome partitioning protein
MADILSNEKIELVPVEKLKFSKNRVRICINREEIALMAKNLKLFGILQPLEINSRNEVILGTRRFQAAKLASLKEVPAIRRDSHELHEIEKQLVCDLHAKHISLLERAHAFQKLIELKNMTKYGLAKYLSLSNNLVCRTLSILEASAETMQLMKAGKISQRMVASVLYRLKDKSKEKYVIERIMKEKMSVAQAENLVAEINDSSVLKKHFLKQVKSFSTSLKKFKEKSNVISINSREKKEIDAELKKISEIIRK